MNPRRLVLLLAAIACWLPPPAWPQQPTRLPMVAILSDGGPTACGSGNTGEAVACMVDGLRALGHVAGPTFRASKSSIDPNFGCGRSGLQAPAT